jgi:GT2 family glycosyltransferase
LNKAAGMCKGQFIAFLNNDAALHPKAIEELVKAASVHRRFDFFQPKILMADDRNVINSVGIAIHYCGFGSLAEGGEHASRSIAVREISGVHGACFMSRLDVFRDLGGFDSSFFSFYEDTDLSWRALLSGRRIIYVPSALVYHKWGQAWGILSSAKVRVAERNRLMMLLTNYDSGTLLVLGPLIVFTEIGVLVWATKHHVTRAKLQSYSDLIYMRAHLRSRRKMIKGMRRKSDIALLGMFTSQLDQVRLGGPWLSPTRFIYRLFEIVVIRHL